jgi:glycine/D-amino acid oxidase-like deaminating enzyme
MPSCDSSNTHTHTVILGSGIIGLCTAYYLSESGNTDPKSICLVDSSPELFRCASGLAAGFLSADCTFELSSDLTRAHFLRFVCTTPSNDLTGFAPSVSSLGTLSFSLHKSLAHTHAGRRIWGYSQSTGISLSQDSESAIGGSGEDWLENGTSRAQLASHNRPWEEQEAGPEWLRRTQEGIMEVISRDGTTAQIDPLRFCQWLLQTVKKRGVKVHQPARAMGIVKDEDGVLSGVRICEGADTETECKPDLNPRTYQTLTDRGQYHVPAS